MAKSKPKYYVVWVGRQTGIFSTWDMCKAQVDNFAGAKYKSYPTYEEAEQALKSDPVECIGKKKEQIVQVPQTVIYPSLSVDAACSGNPGLVEYQGVDTKTKQVIFHQGPFEQGTNNIGEFLALVHGLAYMQQHNYDYPIYSDSRTAQSWVRQKKCKTKLEQTPANAKLFDLVRRAEHWLQTHTYSTSIIKWDTDNWGEIPADFGRK